MTRRRPDERQLNFSIPDEWHEHLRRRAFEERLPIAELVRRALAAAYPELPPREEPDEGRKGGEVAYRPNLRTASALCDRSGS